jgi:hypothetical protein
MNLDDGRQKIMLYFLLFTRLRGKGVLRSS